MKIKKNLYNGRNSSIDAFRGITILVMIFVNDLASVSGMPQWLRHMPANADAMTFVDLVFPAFLFIVGMSIPFAFNTRLSRGDSTIAIWMHTLKRSLALIIMGLFMVNAESGYDASAMLITPALWALLAYTLPIPVWNKYGKNFPTIIRHILQYGGMALFIVLYFLYVQDNGAIGMTPKWWGILGLIGWAYFFTVIWYWFTGGRLWAMIIFFLVAVSANVISQAGGTTLSEAGWFSFMAGHLVHATLVSAGVIISLLFFDGKKGKGINWFVIGTGLFFFIAGWLLRPWFEVSKIRGTPSWTLYSAAICTGLYYILYLLMEEWKRVKWSKFFMPAAENPLLIYILPGIIYYAGLTIGIKIMPAFFKSGITGVAWSLLFSVLMLYLMRLINWMGIRLKL